MSNTAVYFAEESRVPVVREPVLRVEVGGHWRAGLRPVRCRQSAGDVPRLWLELDTGRAAGDAQRWLPESVLNAVRPGDRVTVDLVRGTTLGLRGGATVRLFDGYVEGPRFGYDAGGERTLLEAVDRSDALVRGRVGGQYARVGEDVLWLSGLDLTFNPDGVGNMSAADVSPSGERARRVFVAAGGAGAEAWTASEAANYLLAYYGAASWLELPARAELSRWFGHEVLENVRVEGRSLLEALEVLGSRRGVRATVALAQDGSGGLTRSLVLVGRGRGRRAPLLHQMPGETYDRRRTFLERLDVEVAWCDSAARIEVMGDVALYESTFELHPGWDPSKEDEDETAYRRSAGASFEAVADVFRKWVLNEAGDYCGSPWQLPGPYDFSEVFGTTAYLPRRRRLLPSISTDALGQSRGVQVELSYDGGTTWRRYGGAVRVLREECGVYLAGDRLSAELYRAAKAGLLRCRVTAAVESDERLRATAEREGWASEGRGRRRWVDVSRDYRRRVVCASSVWSGGPSTARDDTAALESLASALFESQRYAPVRGTAVLPTFSLSYRVGDAVEGVRYRYARLRRNDDGIESAPYVASVTQRWTEEGWRTELELA